MQTQPKSLPQPAKAFACKDLNTGLIMVRTITDSPVGAMVNWLYNHANITCLATDKGPDIADKFEKAANGRAIIVPVVIMESTWRDPRAKKN